MTRALSLWSRITYTGVFETHIYVYIHTHRIYLQNISIILVKMFFNNSQQYQQGHSIIIDQENTAIRQVALFWKPRGQHTLAQTKATMVISELLAKMEFFTVNALMWESQKTSVTSDLTSQPSSYSPRYICPQWLIFTHVPWHLPANTGTEQRGSGHWSRWKMMWQKRSGGLNTAKAELLLLAATTYITPSVNWTTDWL